MSVDPFEDDYLDRPPSPWVSYLIQALVGLFFIGLVALGIWLLFVKSDINEDQKSRARSTIMAESFEEVRDSDDPKQIRAFTIKLNSQQQRAPLTKRIELINQKVELADQLLKVANDDSDKEYAYVSKIESLSLLNDLNMEHDLPIEKTEQELLETANQAVDSGLPGAESFAHLARILLTSIRLMRGDATVNEVNNFIDAGAKRLTSNLEDAQRLFNMVRFLNSIEDRPEFEEVKNKIATVLFNSSNDEVVALGGEAMTSIFEKEFGFAELVEGIDYDLNKAWFVDVSGFVNTVVENPKLPIPTYLKALYLIENLYCSPKMEEAGNLFRKLSDTVDALSDVEKKEKIKISMDAHLDRVALLGQEVVIDAVDALGRPLGPDELDGKATALLLFSKSSVGASKYLSALNDLVYLKPEGIELLVVAVDVEEREEVEQLAIRYPAIRWFSGGDSRALIDRIPLTFLPYLIVLGPSGTVQAINVPPTELRSRLQSALPKKGNVDSDSLPATAGDSPPESSQLSPGG